MKQWRRRVCIYCCIQTCFVVYCHFDEFQMIIFFNSEEFTSNHNRRVDRSEEHVELGYKRTDLDWSWWLAVACLSPIQNKRLGTFKYILEVEDFLARRWGFISSINLPIMWWGFKMSSWYHHCDHHVCQSLRISLLLIWMVSDANKFRYLWRSALLNFKSQGSFFLKWAKTGGRSEIMIV